MADANNPASFTSDNPNPIMGIAAVAARDSEHQSPTQIMGMNPRWPSTDAITSVVDIGDVLSGKGYYGGPMPLHSLHWGQYFSSDMHIFPSGKTPAFIVNPDPSGVMDAVADPQNMASGNGGKIWDWYRTTFRSAWQKATNPNNYKQ